MDDERKPGPPKRIEITTSAQRKKAEILARQKARGGPARSADTVTGRQRALELLKDPVYVKNLKTRLRQGLAERLEVWLWRLAYGEPEKNEAERAKERERFELMRTQLRAFLEQAPDRAAEIDRRIQGASRKLLPMPSIPRDVEAEIVDPEDLRGA